MWQTHLVEPGSDAVHGLEISPAAAQAHGPPQMCGGPLWHEYHGRRRGGRVKFCAVGVPQSQHVARKFDDGRLRRIQRLSHTTKSQDTSVI